MTEDYTRGFREGWEDALLFIAQGVISGQIKSLKTLKATLETTQKIGKKVSEKKINIEEEDEILERLDSIEKRLRVLERAEAYRADVFSFGTVSRYVTDTVNIHPKCVKEEKGSMSMEVKDE